MIKVLTNVMDRPRHAIISLLLVAALSISTTAIAGEILFVSDSETDAINIPAVLSGNAPEVDLGDPDDNVTFRDGDEAAGFHNVTIIRNDYAVTGGAFGEAEGTNLALLSELFPALPGDPFPYCSVFWSASGPHEPLGLFPDRITNGNLEDINGTHGGAGPITLMAGDTRLTGWNVDADISWDVGTPASNGASAGVGFVDLAGAGMDGQISQMLATDPGVTYMLSVELQGNGALVALNGSYLLLTAGASSGSWTTYTAMFSAPTAMTSVVIQRNPGDASGMAGVDNVRFAPYPQTPGLGADGGLHIDADVLANLDYYVRNGGFVFVTGHDAITHPPSAPEVSDGPLVKFLGGVGASSGQTVNPSYGTTGNDSAIGVLGTTPSGGGINQIDGVREQDFLAGYDAATTPLVLGPGGAYWSVRSPYGDGVDDDGTVDGVDLTDGHIAYVANGVFYYDTDRVDEFGGPLPPLSDGEDPSWLTSPYNAALLNFATNSCFSAASAETPTADDQSVSTFVNTLLVPTFVDITLTGFDPNGDPLTYAIVTLPGSGNLGTLVGDTVRYTPGIDYVGNDSFTFTVDDGTHTSPPATVSIEVLPIPPLAVDAGPDVSIDEGSGTPFASAGSFIDPTGSSWTATVNYGEGGPDVALALTGQTFSLGNPYPTDDDAVFLVTVTVSSDSDTDSDTAVVFINNVPPSVDAGSDDTISEGETFVSSGSFTDPGTDDSPFTATVDYGDGSGPQPLTILAGDAFALSHIYLTSGEYTVTVAVTDKDGGIGADTATVTVSENTPPELDPIGNQATDELATLNFTATASDTDVPADTLTFSLDAGAPAGASIDPLTGLFSWTATEAQGPGLYPVTVRVTDDGGVPGLDDFETIDITVNEVNVAPVLDPIGNQSIDEGSLLSFTATAMDADIPANTLTFSLDSGAPSGASIDPLTGLFSWTPTEAQGPGVFAVTVRVTDDGAPNLDDLETIDITVNEVNVAPVLDPIGNQSIDELATLNFTATASDTDVPADTLTFSLDGGAPAGASIDPLTGLFSWTPTEAQGPGVYPVTVRVTDDGGVPGLDDFETIDITVNEVNVAPVLDPIGDQPVDELTTLNFTATASDADLPANTLTFSLDAGAPPGASINPSTGQFSWTPSEAQGPGVFSVTVRVTDDGVPSLDDFEEISITVSEVNVAPVLGGIGNKLVNELTPLSFTATASDADLPADTLTFSLDAGAPPGASINPATGQFSWTPTEIQGPGMYSVTVRVTDNGAPNLDDAETISITVNEVNVAPVLGPIGNQTIDELTPLSFTATAVDVDIPLNMLTFSLDAGAPAGASINPSTGQFSWTPTEAQGPGSFPITVRVTDNGLPNLSDAETITVEVNEVNQPPVVTVSLASQTVDYSDNITNVTITATDGDLPPAPITFTPVGVPAALVTSGGCTIPPGVGTTCSWTLSGIANVSASTHVITFNVSDGKSMVSPTTTVVVEAEDATATLHEDNDVAVLVGEPGGDSGAFSLTVLVQETLPDNAEAGPAAAGDIDNAVVDISLVPVGPGPTVSPTGACTEDFSLDTGYDQVLTVTCYFDNVPVNTYSVDATVNVIGYYSGFVDDVLTVYDPSLGFTTGGGWFYWPGTNDKTNFGYTMKYGKNGRNVRGSLLIMRHMDDGTKYRFKSNALEGLAVGQSMSPEFGWASFSGKGTYLEPGWPDPIGNHTFTVYVEDHDEPGAGADRLWIETRDKDGAVLPGLTIGPSATGDAEVIDGGNIVVPHVNNGGKK